MISGHIIKCICGHGADIQTDNSARSLVCSDSRIVKRNVFDNRPRRVPEKSLAFVGVDIAALKNANAADCMPLSVEDASERIFNAADCREVVIGVAAVSVGDVRRELENLVARITAVVDISRQAVQICGGADKISVVVAIEIKVGESLKVERQFLGCLGIFD